MQEIAVVQRLQAEIVELQVALGFERGGKFCQIEAADFRIDQFVRDAGFHIGAEVIDIAIRHLRLRRLMRPVVDEAQGFAAELVE